MPAVAAMSGGDPAARSDQAVLLPSYSSDEGGFREPAGYLATSPSKYRCHHKVAAVGTLSGFAALLLCYAVPQSLRSLNSNGVNLDWQKSGEAFRVRMTRGSSDWKWDIQELEFFGDSTCTKKLHSTSYVESAHYGDDPNNFWSPKKAFDGNLQTGWGGRAKSSQLFLGLQGLQTVRCIKIHQGGAAEVAVEKMQPLGSWRVMTQQSVRSGTSTQLKVPDDQDLCQLNEHVVNAKCVACPVGSTKPAGDDPFGANTGCLCMIDQRVSGGRCVACPDGESNDAGDDTSKGDSICDTFPVYPFDMGATLAMHLPWTVTTNQGSQSKPRTPREIYTAACKSQVIVTWTSQETRPFDSDNQWQHEGDTYGHISTFSTGTGVPEMTANYKLSWCSEMGGVTASADCSVIAALCISRKSPRSMPNMKKNLVEETKDSKGRTVFGWDDVYEQQPDAKSAAERQILSAYLFEWSNGYITYKPDTSVLVNTAIGGWRYGTWEVSLSADKSVYALSLKTTLYGGGVYHEGAVRFELIRPHLDSFAKQQAYACGEGHVLWNRQAYNNAKGQSGFWCWTDAPGKTKGSLTAWFVEGYDSKGKIISDVPRLDPNAVAQIGGPTDLVSRGSKGWLGVLTAAESSHSTKTKLGLASLPGGQPMWLNLGGRDEGVSWPKLARVGSTSEESDRFLLGWGIFKPSSTWNAWGDTPSPTRFHVAEVDQSGRILGQVYQVDNTAWHAGTQWTTVPETGCVAWASAWSDASGPRGLYGSWEKGVEFDTLYSNKLRLSLYCPLSSRRPPVSDRRRQSAPRPDSKDNKCTTPGGHVCVMPFTYNGMSYSACAKRWNGGLWCATQVDSYGAYVGEWAECPATCKAPSPSPAATTTCKTTYGTPCVFPFKYKGTAYTACAKSWYGNSWCATKVSSNGDYIPGQYGDCSAECPA